MSIEQLLKELGINKVGSYPSNDTYVIDLDSSDEFGKIYSLLDTNSDLDYEEESSILTVDNSSMIYDYKEEFQLILLGDFKNNLYKLTVKEI